MKVGVARVVGGVEGPSVLWASRGVRWGAGSGPATLTSGLCCRFTLTSGSPSQNLTAWLLAPVSGAAHSLAATGCLAAEGGEGSQI